MQITIQVGARRKSRQVVLRTTAYVYSFIDQCRDFGKQGASRIEHGLTQEDMQRAEKALWRLAQADAYAEEINVLREQQESDEQHDSSTITVFG